MKLNLFVAWSGYALALVAVLTIALALVAAGTGYGGHALTSGIVAAVAVILGILMVAGASRRDHRHHMETPHLF
ncbi:MAG: hypothetical protein GXY65_08325 [Rhodococcus sp.]|uniref:hypothetical protein n=1 Tax=Rhodococcus TaxID=1827 RepID=UPI0016A8FEB4|nr:MULTISPECIES: hypothetical protein [Rhodococcus]NLV79332.1 hypothetical protein [Rhodococcus sp. (in: high G+C Gram-positive bacteria)]